MQASENKPARRRPSLCTSVTVIGLLLAAPNYRKKMEKTADATEAGKGTYTSCSEGGGVGPTGPHQTAYTPTPRRERGEEKKKTRHAFWVVLGGWPTGAELAGGDALGEAWRWARLARRVSRLASAKRDTPSPLRVFTTAQTEVR
eukprot:scaffold12681_cov101-Isochrysis_galbana.AAC.2